MTNNLIIFYDLHKPGQNHDIVKQTIENLPAPKIHLQSSVFYVSTLMTAGQVADRVFSVMDLNDQLIVVDATNKMITFRGNISLQTKNFIQYHWFS